MKKTILVSLVAVATMTSFANAALPADVVTEINSISVADLADIMKVVVGVGAGLFAFRKVRSILKA